MYLRSQFVSLTILFSILTLPTAAHSETASQAAVTFTLDFPSSQPEHYSIRVQSGGLCHYESNGHISADSDETDSFELDFPLTAETRQKVFELAAKAGYFKKDVDSHHKGLAFTGKKTLAYKDAQRSGESTFNYSSVTPVQELTALMQNLSSTLEFGHRLKYDHHYQKLALEEEFKRMEDTSSKNPILEVGAIQSILNEIVADPSVINVTRARAQRMLERQGTH